MTTINGTKKNCTLINVFTTEPAKQKELFENLKEASEKIFNKMPGYISANIHLGDDGITVTNYAQWASSEDYKKIFNDPQVKSHMDKAAALAIKFEPVIYTTIWTDNND